MNPVPVEAILCEVLTEHLFGTWLGKVYREAPHIPFVHAAQIVWAYLYQAADLRALVWWSGGRRTVTVGDDPTFYPIPDWLKDWLMRMEGKRDILPITALDAWVRVSVNNEMQLKHGPSTTITT